MIFEKKKPTTTKEESKIHTQMHQIEREGEWKQEKYKIICACVRANWVSVMCIFDAALNSSCRFKDSQAKINVWPKNVRFVFKMVPHASQIKSSKRSVRVCNVIYYIITMNDILNKIAIPSKQDQRKNTPSAWQLHIMVAKDILRKLARKKSIWWLNHDTMYGVSVDISGKIHS